MSLKLCSKNLEEIVYLFPFLRGGDQLLKLLLATGMDGAVLLLLSEAGIKQHTLLLWAGNGLRCDGSVSTASGDATRLT